VVTSAGNTLVRISGNTWCAKRIRKVNEEVAVWFPTVRTNTGTDVFTERLVNGLNQRGIRAEITWLPLRAEYAPWSVLIPKPPAWARIAHVNTWLHSRFLPRRIPVIATVHHSIHDPAVQPYKGLTRSAYHRWWIAPNERRVMHRAKLVIAVSHFAANIARQALADVPIEVIHNGINIDKFRPPTGPRNAHRPFRLLYVGNWSTLKGVELLAPIMTELGTDFELRYTRGTPNKSADTCMPSNTHDIGRLRNEDEVAHAMRKADALLLPSRSEGFGLVAAEAMACGLPPIATQGSSLMEIIEDGVTGSLCEQDNIQSFVDAVRSLAENQKHWKKLSREGRRLASQQYDLNGMVDAYVSSYISIVSAAQPQSPDSTSSARKIPPLE